MASPRVLAKGMLQMVRYQVAIIDRPENWRPEGVDDVPEQISGPVETLAETLDLLR